MHTSSICLGVGRFEKVGVGGWKGNMAGEKWWAFAGLQMTCFPNDWRDNRCWKKVVGVSTWWVAPVAPKEGLVY